MRATQPLIDFASNLMDKYYDDVAAGKAIISGDGNGTDTGSIYVGPVPGPNNGVVEAVVDHVKFDASVIIRRWADGKQRINWGTQYQGTISRVQADDNINTGVTS